jgi:hypothetical protein
VRSFRSVLSRRAVAVASAGLVVAGCGTSAHPATDTAALRQLQREARPIGRGPRFHEPARGPVGGHCRPRLGPRFAVHVELFAADRVVLIPAGIGVRHPTAHVDGRITRARCYGDLVTLDPTGVVLARRASGARLGQLFAAWGQPLSRTRLAAFAAGAGDRVRVFVAGRPWTGPPGRVPLTRHAEVVLEVGPYVPPHRRFTFAGG